MNVYNREEPEAKSNGVIGIQHTYTLAGFLANKSVVRPGDRVKLPEFNVPEATIGGENPLEFSELKVSEYAVAVGRNEKEILLKLEHALFGSAVDLNGETEFEKTQLGKYLDGVFKDSMKKAGIPAETCRLITHEEMFGDSRLDFFKVGKNRISFDAGENISRWCWLGTIYNSFMEFYGVNSHGLVSCNGAAYTYGVSPAFTIR